MFSDFQYSATTDFHAARRQAVLVYFLTIYGFLHLLIQMTSGIFVTLGGTEDSNLYNSVGSANGVNCRLITMILSQGLT